jgi:hypothetical protein
LRSVAYEQRVLSTTHDDPLVAVAADHIDAEIADLAGFEVRGTIERNGRERADAWRSIVGKESVGTLLRMTRCNEKREQNRLKDLRRIIDPHLVSFL